jgi:hypothetical protein
MQYPAWKLFATYLVSRIYISELLSLDTGKPSEHMQIWCEVFTLGERKDIRDGCPRITSHIVAR